MARPSSVEIAGDGSYASVYSDGNLIGNMMTLRKVSENGFIITSDGAQNGCFGIVGIGGNPGPNAKVEFGFIIEGQLLKNVSWTVTIGAEDYSNPSVLATFTNPNFVVKEEETVTSSSTTSSSSSETKTSEEQVSAKKEEPQKLFGILPMTGEIISVLGATGFVIIGIVSYLKIRNKK